MSTNLTPELRALAQQAFQHQSAGRYAEAAQGYLGVLSRVPDLWSACYNLGLVYQHLERLPEAAEMYIRAVKLNPQLAQAHNNLGNVLKALKNDAAAIDAYQHAIALNPQLSEASYNLATMLQVRGEHTAANEMFRKTVAINPMHLLAWDALYRSLLGLRRYEEAKEVFLEWDRAMPPCPELVTAGLALCRPIGDPAFEARYLALALDWPFANITPEQFVPVLGMMQYFDVTREQLLACYRRYDAAVAAKNPVAIPLLPRRAADTRLRIGYVSADFRRHVMGRWMLEVISRHNRSRVSIFLVSTCPPREYDAFTDAFRSHADGFADISEMDDFTAAKNIAEADLDILVDLAGHTMAARPGIYAHRPARSIVTHLGYHGCLGLSAVDYKLTDHIADGPDAAQFQIEKPFALDTCVFPFVRGARADVDLAPGGIPELEGKFVFAAFTNELKLSSRCLAVWRRVLDALPEAVLLFSPPSATQHAGISRIMAGAGIDNSRIAFLQVPVEEALWRARYRLVDAVLDTFPYAGGDTTLAALDMGVPVVTLNGLRHSERVGTSILSYLGITETIANSGDEFVAIAVRLARDAQFMAQTRQRIEIAVAATDVQAYTRALEDAYVKIAAEKPVAMSMTLSARQFFQSLRDAIQRHRKAPAIDEQNAAAAIYAALRTEQPNYVPLLRAQGELAQTMGNLALAAECANELLRQLPNDLDVRLSSAGFLIDDGAPAEALNVLPPIADDGENDLRVLKLYTRAHAKLGQWDAALSYSKPAVVLAPADVQVLFWHGLVLSHTGEAESALTFLNRALVLAPDHVEAAYNAGVILAELGNSGDAETVFRRVIAAPAARAEAAVRLAAQLRLLQLLWMQGRYEEWAAEGQQFVDAYPELPRARLITSRIARHCGHLERETEILQPLAETVVTLHDDVIVVELVGELLATLRYQDVPAPLLQRLANRFRDAARAIYPASLPPSPATQPAAMTTASLRIGYLVDFSQPFVTDLMHFLVIHHDHRRVKVHVYAISPLDTANREKLESAGARQISVATLDEYRAAQTIRADKLDILVDVAAFGPYAKPGVLSYRPARVQLSLPGLTQPAAIGELDYRLSDTVADHDAANETDFTAPLLVEGCVFPLLPAAQVPLPPRVQLGIDRQVPVFGVLASSARLSSRCLTTWKALSDKVPAAIFFVCPMLSADREPLRKLLLAGGIDASRILMLSASYPRPRDLSLAGVVDVILDTMPGSDYFSTRAAILDSIPIVSMAGRMFEERVALTLLSHLGDRSTVAASGRDYIDLAANLVLDQTMRQSRANRQQALLEKSCLTDMQHYTARVENALFRAVAAADAAAATTTEQADQAL